MTSVGFDWDNSAIALIAALGASYQVSSLNSSSSILKQLNPIPRDLDINQVVGQMTKGLSTEPVTHWMDIVDNGDFLHDYMVSFGAIIANVFNLVFP